MAKLGQVGIFNLALTKIGHRKYLSSVEEDGLESEVLNLHWDHCLSKALEEIDWGFARKREALALIGDATPEEWEYVYAWPADCAMPLYVVDGLKVRRPDQRYPFVIENFNGQRVIYCDVEEAELVYTSEVTETTLFSEHFADALAWRLAAEAAMPLTNEPKVVEWALGMFERSMQRAIVVEYGTGTDPEPPETDSIAARG